MNKLIVVDVETDGPAPGLFSMVSLGAIIVDNDLNKTFFGQTAPISDQWDPEALAISKITRQQHLEYPDPATTITSFHNWLVDIKGDGKITFISDNLAFDWQFINYYLHRYTKQNIFGFSGRRIGDLFSGMKNDMRASWKHLRKTNHDHNPVNDAKGNAEALLAMKDMGLKLL